MSLSSLPAGWTVSNRNGAFSGPPPRDDEDEAVAEELEDIEGVDVRPDSPGWEDVNVEDDAEEPVSVKSFFSNEVFGSAREMVSHCEERDGFSFGEVLRRHKLDFLSAIKLVNYIRSEVASGKKPNVSDAQLWADDRYLQPVVENDPMLFSLGEFEGLADADLDADAGAKAGEDEEMQEA